MGHWSSIYKEFLFPLLAMSSCHLMCLARSHSVSPVPCRFRSPLGEDYLKSSTSSRVIAKTAMIRNPRYNCWFAEAHPHHIPAWTSRDVWNEMRFLLRSTQRTTLYRRLHQHPGNFTLSKNICAVGSSGCYFVSEIVSLPSHHRPVRP